MKNIIRHTIIYFVFYTCAISQEMPIEFFDTKIEELSFSLGSNWTANTTFGPLRFRDYAARDNLHFSDSININVRSGFLNRNKNMSLYFYEHITFKKNFYSYLYTRIVDNSSEFPRYTGKPRGQSRFGFYSGEVDLSGIGYENEWMIFQIGRGRQSWGAGEKIQLVLSNDAASYDHLLFGLDFNSIRFKYINGFLESDSLGFNRYIVARGIEYTNLKSLVMSLSEIVIYSGLNRPIDFSYFNPISTHLEIELNDRQNRLGTKSGNGAWQASLDWMVNKRLRFSGNLVFDEVVLDKSEKKLGKEHITARSLKISNNFSNSSINKIIGYVSIMQVGTSTFRHGDGRNNFINRNIPIGWSFGSDCVESKIGLNIFNEKSFILSFEGGNRKNGDNSILYAPYEKNNVFNFSKFPSGNIKEISFISSYIVKKINSHMELKSSFEYQIGSSENREIIFNISLDLFLSKKIL